jgi:hypothetical protein
MRSDLGLSRGGVLGQFLGVMAIAMIVLMAGCAGNGGAPFTITTTSGQLATVVVNSSYPATTFAAANGTAPYTWAWSGNTPAGLSLSPAGMISGTPTAFGTFSFTVTVTDSATPTAHTATATLSVLINPALTSVAMNPVAVTGGTSSTGTVTLSGPAAASAAVTLSSNSAAAVVPASVTVAAGATTATFQATTSGVSSSTPATITATYGVAKTATLTVNVPTVASVTLAQATITGGAGTTGTVTLTGPAATGGDSVVLSSNNAAAQVPATVTVAAGASSAQFNVTSTAVVSNATATIQASFNSSMQSAPLLTVVPAPSITSFTRAAATITTGTSTTLTALFSNGTGSVSNSVGAVTSGTPVTVSPTTTTTYTLTVTNAAGTSVTQQATVTVVPAPVITSFTSAAMTITAGGSTTLTGVFSGGTGSVNNSVGTVTSGTAVTVSPAATTTYTLTVTNSAVTPATATQTVTVNVVAAPVITSFVSGAATITSGTPTTLTAVFSGGTGSVDNGVGAVTSGTPVSVSPTTTTTYTLTVTNAANTNATATVTITVQAPPSITSNNSTTFTVAVNGNFTVQTTGSPAPSLVETGALPTNVNFVDNGNGTATLSGAPAVGSATSYPITITAHNGIGTDATQSFTLNVVADPCATIVGGNEALLTGHYAFVLKGFDNGTTGTETGPEPALVGGVLVFNGTNNNGQITAGTLDMNLNATAGVSSQTVTGGTYKINSATDHRGCMAITTAGGTQHYRFSLGNIAGGVASTGHMIDFDSTGPFTAGDLLKQSGTIPTTLSGNFAFGVSSAQNTANSNINSGSGGSFGAIGTMTFASNGTLTAGNVDFSQNGFLDGNSAVGGSWPLTGASLSAGSYSIAASGRGTFAFTPGGGSSVHTIIYVVSSSEFLILDNDDQTQNSVFAGSGLLQSTASFTANPLSGNYVGYQSGLGSTSGTSRVTLFLLDASGTGISGTQLRNDGGSFQLQSLSGITYTVAASGRMTITAGGGSNNPLFYVVSPSQVFFLSSDTGVDTGFFQSQSGSPFTNASASGTYAFGTVDPQDSNVSMNSGVALFATPNVTVTEDDNSNGSQNSDQTQSITYSVDSTGLGHLPSGCTVSSNSTTCSTVFYVISPTKAVVMDTGSSNAKAQIADQ